MLSNTAMGLSLAVVLVGLSFWVWRTNRSAALVAICHNAIWGITLLLVATNLIRYDEASPSAWAVLATSLVMFNVGASLSGRLRFRSRSTTPGEGMAPAAPSLALMGRRTFFVMFSLYILAFIAYLAVQLARVGDVSLLMNPSALRDIDGVSNLESTPIAIRAVFYLGPILFAVLAFKEGMRNPLPLVVRVAGVLVLFGTMIALLQRTNVFLSVLIWLGLLVTRHFGTKSRDAAAPAGTAKARSFSPVKVGAIALVAVLLLLGTFQVVAVTLGKNGSQALSTGNVSPTLERSGLTSVFTYFTGGVPAFLQLVDSNDHSLPPEIPDSRPEAGEYNPLLWGASTFGPVLRFVPGYETWNPIEPFIDMGIAINVYTWNGPIYRDFRVVGVGALMLLTGALISTLHTLRYRSARIFWLQGALLSGVFLSTFASVSQWGNIMIVFYLAVFALTANWRRVTAIGRRTSTATPGSSSS
jgi:oligosaccharide repeat unit polymerase